MVFSLKCSRRTKILNCYDVEPTTTINVYTKITESKQCDINFQKRIYESSRELQPFISDLCSEQSSSTIPYYGKEFGHLDYYTVLGKKITRFSQSKTFFEYSTCQCSQKNNGSYGDL